MLPRPRTMIAGMIIALSAKTREVGRCPHHGRRLFCRRGSLQGESLGEDARDRGRSLLQCAICTLQPFEPQRHREMHHIPIPIFNANTLTPWRAPTRGAPTTLSTFTTPPARGRAPTVALPTWNVQCSTARVSAFATCGALPFCLLFCLPFWAITCSIQSGCW